MFRLIKSFFDPIPSWEIPSSSKKSSYLMSVCENLSYLLNHSFDQNISPQELLKMDELELGNYIRSVLRNNKRPTKKWHGPIGPIGPPGAPGASGTTGFGVNPNSEFLPYALASSELIDIILEKLGINMTVAENTPRSFEEYANLTNKERDQLKMSLRRDKKIDSINEE